MGSSTIFDEACRANLFKIIQLEQGITRLILNHAFVKVFRGDDLEILKNLNDFIEGLQK